jgi:hypothetical protein
MFELQAAFAHRFAMVGGLTETESLRLFTVFYACLAVDNDAGAPPVRWDFDPAHPKWQDFLDAVDHGADPVGHVYQHYLDSLGEDTVEAPCFQYEYWPDLQWVRLHFDNSPDGLALREESIPRRLTELRQIFSDVALNHPEAMAVRGTSWLYHLPAYRRLFPVAFIDSLRSLGHLHQFPALWGQFLDRHGNVKDSLGQSFRRGIALATTPKELNDCFPYDVLAATGDIRDFYTTYGVSPPKAE